MECLSGGHLEESVPLAVHVHGLSKTYERSTFVFRNVHLQLPIGKIFGLLGPSGCGKTTLLRCIVGRVQPDRGSILVFGHPTGTEPSGIPGPNVGYMPQDTLIFETLTIGECLRYYGRLSGMSDVKIASATDHILGILNLPSQSTLTGNLSGGEQRRVAFAVALLHEPKLLILDEPTVGVDPITKARMWQHLFKLTKDKGTSVIITTHYIEEARAAHKVGLMQGKTMAEEEYTDRLLVKYECATLEEVFLKICHGERADFNEDSVVLDDSSASATQMANVKRTFLPQLKDLRIRPHIIRAIFVKNFLNFYRFPGAFICLLIIPGCSLALSVYGLGSPIHDLTLAIANEDNGRLGETFVSQLDPWMFRLIRFPTFQDGLVATRDGKTYGVVGIGQNFSETFPIRLLDAFSLDGDLFKQSNISVALDNSHYLICSLAKYHILTALWNFQNSVVRDHPEANPMMAELIVQFDQKTMESFKVPSSFVLILGIMFVMAVSSPIGVVLLSFFIERVKGHLERTFITGVSALEIFVGLGVLLVLMLVVQVSLLMVPVFWKIESMTSGGSVLVCLILLLGGIEGIALGFSLALIVDRVVIVLMASGLAVAMMPAFGGHIWPLEALNNFSRPIFQMTPISCPVQAIMAVVSRGWDLRYVTVQWGCWSPILWTMAMTVLNLILFKMRL